jgi:hypothetical protein
MSRKIDDILEVLAIIQQGYRGSVREARIHATHVIAKRRRVTYQIVSDAYKRGLEPEIKGTPAFDHVVEDWFSSKSNYLKRILAFHAFDKRDRARIRTDLRLLI